MRLIRSKINLAPRKNSDFQGAATHGTNVTGKPAVGTARRIPGLQTAREPHLATSPHPHSLQLAVSLPPEMNLLLTFSPKYLLFCSVSFKGRKKKHQKQKRRRTDKQESTLNQTLSIYIIFGSLPQQPTCGKLSFCKLSTKTGTTFSTDRMKRINLPMA